MKQHFCYYCDNELIKDISLVTFYTKECLQCKAQYFFDMVNDKLTMIVLTASFHDKTYSVNHDIGENRIRICLRRDKIIWEGSTAEVLPIEIIRFDGDFNTVRPSNINERLKTILTFL